MSYRHVNVPKHVSTLKLPETTYQECMRMVVETGSFSSLNDFYVYAIRKALDERLGKS